MAEEMVSMEHPKTKARRDGISRRSFERIWSNPDRVKEPWKEVKSADSTKKKEGTS